MLLNSIIVAEEDIFERNKFCILVKMGHKSPQK